MPREGIVVAVVVLATFSGIATAEAAAPLASAGLPPRAVAVVRDAPPRVSTISLQDFHHGLAQWAARRELDDVPKPGDRIYQRAETAVLTSQLETADAEGQAAEMGLTVSKNEVGDEVARLKQANFKSNAEYVAFLKQSHYTRGDVFESVRLQILATGITDVILQGVQGKKAADAALSRFRHDFIRRWRPRNICAPNFAVPICAPLSLGSSRPAD